MRKAGIALAWALTTAARAALRTRVRASGGTAADLERERAPLESASLTSPAHARQITPAG